MKEWYQQTKEEILSQFQVTEQGLTSSQAEKILAEKGENVLEEGKRKSTLQVFLEQFCDLLVVILYVNHFYASAFPEYSARWRAR